jgi:hypothetical protein
MKRIAGLLLMIMSSAVFLAAQESKAQAHEMTGWVCNSKCVTQSADRASCDQNCSDNTGDTVFIDDQGGVFKIANQDMAKPHTGKKVKGMVKMQKDQNNEDQMYFESIRYYGGGG